MKLQPAMQQLTFLAHSASLMTFTRILLVVFIDEVSNKQTNR